MSNDLNQCNFIGRLGNEPELKFMPNGNAVCNISIAVGEKYKDKKTGQPVETTEWVRIASFNRLAEIMGQYLKKGSKVFVTGKMRTRKWQDQNGQDRYTTEIVASEIQMLDSRAESSGWVAGSQPSESGAGGHVPPQSDAFDDNIPF